MIKLVTYFYSLQPSIEVAFQLNMELVSRNSLIFTTLNLLLPWS